MAVHKETELYLPVKRFLEQQGFTVRGEVNGCDLMAVRDQEALVVELKTSFTLPLVLQGIERQRLTETVYVAVVAPRSGRSQSRWSDIQHLCRRLGLGLLTVSFVTKSARVEVVLDPDPQGPQRNLRKRRVLLREFGRRSADHNTGGVTRRPIVTAYREEMLRVVLLLKEHGPTSLAALRSNTGLKALGPALQRDYYGWFERVERGVYRLSAKGEQALILYADVINAGMA